MGSSSRLYFRFELYEHDDVFHFPILLFIEQKNSFIYFPTANTTRHSTYWKN